MSHTTSALLNNAPYSFFRSALKSVIVPALGLCGLLLAPSVSADDHIFSEMDVFGIEYASDPQVSPDGSQVAYVRTSMDIMTDRARRSIWIVDIDGKNHRPMIDGAGSFSSPRWSPSGDRLAYLSNAEGGRQLFVRWLDAGATTKVTGLPQSPGGITWSPDGQMIAFTRFVPAKPPTLASMPAAPKGAKWAEPATVVDRMMFRADGAGYLPTGNNQLFVVSAEGGTPRQLTDGDYSMGWSISWGADSQSIVFSGNRSEDYAYQPGESALYEVALDSGEITQLTDIPGSESSPILSPDGKLLAYRASTAERQSHKPSNLMIMDRASGEITPLTDDFDRSIDRVQWAGNSKSLWVGYDDQGFARIAQIDLKGKMKTTNAKLGGTTIGRPYSSGSFSVGGKDRIAFTLGRDDRPADLAVLKGMNSSVTLTDLNSDVFGHKAMGRAEQMTWPSSHDGQTIEGWIVKPPGFDPEQQYPMILEIHGGPHTAYGPNYSTEVQLYAAAGYVVFYTNPRGSTSYGEAFANEIDLAYPGYDYDDLISGVDALIAKGYVDPDQLFVTGGSGGGVLTAWIVGNTDRFSAAVVAKPVINWASFVLTADANYYFATNWFDAPPWEDYETYWKRSPLSLVGNVETPTMLLTGEADYRTPMSETEQYYQALKHRGIDTLMVRIPNASHSIYARPSNLIAKVNNILAWFERYRDTEEESADEE